VRATDVTVIPDGRTARVERLLPLGPRTRIIIEFDGSRILSDTANPPPEPLTELQPGSPIDLYVVRAVALPPAPQRLTP
jgi:hypothetical protein